MSPRGGFDQTLIDEVKSRTPLAALIGRRIKLERDGSSGRLKGVCPFHADKGPSLAIYPDGHFYCFGCGAMGDAFEYVMRLDGITFPEAMRKLAGEAGVELPEEGSGPKPGQKPKHTNGKEKWFPMLPPPADAGLPPESMLASFDMVHRYTSLDDRETHYVGRIEARGDKRKLFVPITFGVLTNEHGNTVRAWHKKAPHAPRPLYGLNKLTSMPDAVVVLLEGEKKADAAQRMLPDYACLSWFGGHGQADNADVTPLADRQVIFWRDADKPGLAAMHKLLPKLPAGTQVVRVDDLSDGFDAADLEQQNPGDPEAWLAERLEPAPSIKEPLPQGSLTLRYGWGATQPISAGTIVRGLLHAGSLTLFYGPPKSGKSFLATSLCLSISDTADEWMGHRILRHGAVLYVACEGHTGFWKRLRAEAKSKGWDEATFPKQFILATGRPTLIQLDDDIRAYVPHPDDILAAIEQAKRDGLSLIAIAIDTIFRSFGGGNVNASDHMNAYLSALSEILDLGMAVLAIHHEIKSGGTPAGSVTLLGGADTIVHIEKISPEGASHQWRIEAAKDDAETDYRKFDLPVIDIGVDPEGQAASSCVVKDLGAAEALQPSSGNRGGGRPRNLHERDLALKFLHDALAQYGEAANGVGIPPGVQRVVHIDRWREEFYRRARPDDTVDSKRKAFQRLVRELQVESLIGVAGILIWPVAVPP